MGNVMKFPSYINIFHFQNEKTRYWEIIDLFGKTHVAKKWLKIA